MKLVKEILYEKFTADSDPIHDLGIGVLYNLDKLAISILKKDTKKMFYTVLIEGDKVILFFNSPEIRETKYITSQEQAKDYADKLIYKKLKLNNIFIFKRITGEYNFYETSFQAHYKLFKDSKKIVKAKRSIDWERSGKINLEIYKDREYES